VRPLLVVVANIATQQPQQMAPPEQQRPVQTVRPFSLDPALGVGIRLRRPDRRSEDLPTLATEHVVEGTSELGIVVAEQKPDRHSPIAEIHRGIPGLLSDPRRVRLGRDPGENDPPATEVDEAQPVEDLEPDRLHRVQVARHDALGLGSQELRPGRAGASRRWAHAVSSQQRPDGRGIQADAELAQLPTDALAAHRAKAPAIVAFMSRPRHLGDTLFLS
jgi:hypothetical protein